MQSGERHVSNQCLESSLFAPSVQFTVSEEVPHGQLRHACGKTYAFSSFAITTAVEPSAGSPLSTFLLLRADFAVK